MHFPDALHQDSSNKLKFDIYQKNKQIKECLFDQKAQENDNRISQNLEQNDFHSYDQKASQSGTQINKNEFVSDQKSFFSDQYEGGANDDNFQKVPDSHQKEKKFDLQNLMGYFKIPEISYDQIDESIFHVFEPQNIFQKIKCIVNNTFEIQMLILIFICSLLNPTLISVFFIILSHNLMFVIAMKTDDRIFYGKILNIINMVILLINISWKLTLVPFSKIFQYTDILQFVQYQKYYASLGYKLADINEESFSFNINMMSSFFLEIIITIAYLFIHKFYDKLQENINASKNKHNRDLITFVKMYEAKHKIDLQREKKTISIGSLDILPDRDSNERLFHMDEVKILQKKVKRIFMSCSYFGKFNSAFFLFIIILQIFQSMNFNGLFDIPQIIMILILVSIYAFRKSFKVQFGQITVFIAYFSSFTCLLKIIQIQLIQIEFVNIYIAQNSSQIVFHAIQMIFGQQFSKQNQSFQKSTIFNVAIILLFYFCHAWRGSKWASIVEKTVTKKDDNTDLWDSEGSYSRLLFYLENKEDDSKCKSIFQKEKEYIESFFDGQKVSKKDSYDEMSMLQMFKKDLNQYLSILIIWLLRLMLTLQAYMYHSNNGLLHLSWVLLSFILPLKWTLIASCIFMIPLYTAEFFTIYVSRIPGIDFSQIYNEKIYNYFVNDKSDFVTKMKNPELEQFMMFFIMCLFYIGISCLKLSFNKNQEEFLISLFQSKIETQQKNLKWKFYFFILKYAHFVPLLILFIHGLKDLNNFRNSSFMILFTVFISSEYLYRKTSIFLNLIASFFILGQYYFSLNYKLYINDTHLMEKLQWLNMYDKDKLNKWNDTDDIYFRFKPYPLDFLVLILASILNMINILFSDTQKAEENSQKCYEIIRNKFSKEIFWMKNIFSVLQRIFRFFIIFIVIISIRYMQTNLINWIFFSLFVINFAFIARQDNKKSTYNKCIISAKLLNYYSAFILVMEILFLALFGLQKQAYLSIFQDVQIESYDYQLFKTFPLIYENLDLIGFRYYIYLNLSQEEIVQNQNDWFRTTFISYIVYQLISVYLISHYQKQLKKNEIDLDIEQEYLKKIFEYETKTNENDNVIDASLDEQYSQNQEKLSGLQNHEKDDEYQKFDEKNEKKLQSHAILEGIFPKKAIYSMYDFIDLYENLRFRDDFTVYKLMEWWWIFDIISFYGHFFTNFIILIISIYFKISFYMLFNIICICIFYSMLAQKMLNKSRELKQKSCLQDQTDVFHAYQITKEFKIYQYHELYSLRNYIWRVQFIVLVIVMCLSFPTSNLVKYIIKQRSQESLNYKANLDQYDTLTFWLFISGIFKDNRQENQLNYYFSYFMIGFALVLERTAINWMFDRFGCTYNKIQKFIEIDLRRQAIQNPEIWQVNPPQYNIQRYKNHYFYDDFEYLQRRFKEFSAESYKLRKEGKQNEFIPSKVALRIKDFITFSVKLEGRCQDLELNKYTEEKLEEVSDLNIDNFEEMYEDLDVLKKYKITQQSKKLKESVNRKYKISFFKGAQLVIESLIVLLLLISIFVKSNIFSIIYGILVSKIIFCSQKLKIMNYASKYVSICFIVQYINYILNLTNLSSPEKFPVQFQNYPFDKDIKTQYGIPLFFKFEVFKDIQISYFFGFAISEKQIHSLILDFLILFFIYLDLFNFGNPVLEKQMKKTFWSYPDKDHIQRLSEIMKEQVKWFRMDQYINDINFKKLSETFSDKEKETAEIQNEYCKNMKLKFKNQNDLKLILNNYLELKYSHSIDIDENFEKKVKWQLKEQSIYFRLVKQGSVLAYLSFHIFTIFSVFLSSIVRQSFLSLGYAFILLPFMKTGSEVLNQRVLNQLNKNQMIERIQYLERKIVEEKDDLTKQSLKTEISHLQKELESQMNEKLLKSHEQIKEEIDINNQKEWKLIKVINVYLLIFSIVDISIQILYQLPLFEENNLLRMIGIHKVWKHEGSDGMHINFKNYWDFGSQGKDKNSIGYTSDFNCFLQQSFLCLIVAVIYLQREIFLSVGFKKFISQTDGSMDFLVKVSVFKAKSMAYIFNNNKIIKIISIQRNKELIIQSVEKVKQQIIKWRKFTTRTLNSEYVSQQTQTDLDFEIKNQIQETILKKNLKEEIELNFDQQIEKDYISDDEISMSSIKYSSQKKKKTNTFVQSQNQQAMKKEFAKKLAKELFLEKKKKLNFLSKFYLFLQNNFVNKIMFKNKKEQIQNILQKHIMKGEVEVYSELEQIMLDEAKQMIEQHLADEEQFQDLIIQTKRFSGKKLLEISNFDKIIKLVHMENTWEYTRSFSIGFKIIETLYYIVISNTHNLIYLFMILSMFNNAGLISLVYPISVFGYALLEENRPRKEFWDFVRSYTTFILCLKFIWNLEIFNNYAHTETFNNFEGITKLGLIDYSNIYQLTLYMLPEVLIISLVMLNEIALKLNGLYYETEQDVENINEGIQRFIEKEDNNKFANQATSNFQLQKIFMGQQLYQSQDQQQKIDESQDQLDTLKHVSYQIYKATKEFDVKIKSQTINHHAQFLISSNIIKKSLENDNLIFVEGHGMKNFVNEFIQTDVEEDCCFSAGDFENDFEEKNMKINNKEQPKPGFFENIKYFDRLFPNLKIQKPGYDLYASTTFFLSILGVFVFLFFDKLTVSETEFLKGAQETNNIFKGQMSLCLIFIILVIILERYINRSDTKAEQKPILSDKNQKSFFNKEQFFENQQNQRSLSIRIKTMKTEDFDLNNNENYEYLKQTYGVKVGDDGQVQQTDMNNSRTKITYQQKTKYILHWFLIILVHVFIFWILPITGNYQLYASPYCDKDTEKYRYGCKNFHNNYYLVIFYIIWLVYFVLSALQIRYGLPIMKKPSSILQYNDNQLAFGAANMFYSLPFAVEVRCLLDFTFSKTSLDIFQFWQTFVYHCELYVSKNGNVTYTRRILGTRTPILDKCIFGWIMTLVIMGVLVGPFYLFSDYGGFIQPNPVLKADISVAFIINKTITPNILSKKNSSTLNIYQINQFNNQTTNKSLNTQNQLRASVPYEIYSVSRPFLRNFDDKQFQSSAFSNWTETRFFESKQVQECVSNEFSDTNWNMNNQLKKQFQQEIQYATAKLYNFSLSLMIRYEFTRENPEETKVSKGKEFKILNYSMLEDCLTGQQLKKLANMNCSDPQNSQQNVKIRFQQVYSRELILGATDKTYPLYRKGILDKHQTYDIFVEYKCPGSWIVYTSRYPNHLNISDKFRQVNNQTCEPIANITSDEQKEFQDIKQNIQNDKDVFKSRLRLFLFSMLVSSSFFASYNVSTFYTTVVLVMGQQIRPLLLWGTWRAFIYECTMPDPIIKVIEYIYMKRHEEDFYGEEEAYRILQEIVRSPELFKALTGSSLLGSCDPDLDKLDPSQLKKFNHLDQLERQGFEVGQLKKQIFNKNN